MTLTLPTYNNFADDYENIKTKHGKMLAELGFELTSPWIDSPRPLPIELPGLDSAYREDSGEPVHPHSIINIVIVHIYDIQKCTKTCDV